MSFLFRPVTYLLILLLGCVLTRTGFFKAGDQQLLSKIIVNITLPCAAVRAFSRIQRDASLLLLILLGLLGSLLPLLIIFLLTKRMDKSRRVFYMLNVSGTNLGSFSLPIVQNFFGEAGCATLFIFDIGNALMCSGGSYAFTSTLLHTDGNGARMTPGMVAKRFFASIPLDVYLVSLALMLLNIPIPSTLYNLLEPVAEAHPFLAMLMLGSTFRPESWRRCLPDTVRLILVRLAFSVVTALLLFFCTPLSLEVRKVLTVLSFAPATMMAVIYTEKCHADTTLCGFANSVSVIVSLFIMSGLSLRLVA